jgi:beta-glucosidase-like glycosyl hydrolase
VKEAYQKQVVPRLMQERSYTTVMAVPRLVKVVVNMGIGEATQNIKLLDAAVDAIIIIDEPELGLHPYAETLLTSMIKSAAARGHQIVISTQSSRLVDNFEPEDIIVVERENSQTIFKPQSTNGLEEWLAEYTLGELWDRDVGRATREAARIGRTIADELRQHGVDFSFTPVLDVDWGRSAVIGDRAFHTDPRVVAMLGAQLMHGLALAGMANCGKHFPGHGWAAADSHVAIPHDARERAALLAADAAPYRWLGPQLTGVMPAHVIYDAVDPAPAGFSSRWIRALRQ